MLSDAITRWVPGPSPEALAAECLAESLDIPVYTTIDARTIPDAFLWITRIAGTGDPLPDAQGGDILPPTRTLRIGCFHEADTLTDTIRETALLADAVEHVLCYAAFHGWHSSTGDWFTAEPVADPQPMAAFVVGANASSISFDLPDGMGHASVVVDVTPRSHLSEHQVTEE